MDSLIESRAARSRRAGDASTRPGSILRHWNTAACRQGDPVSYYRDGICKSFMSMSPEISNSHAFHAALSSRQFGSIKVNRIFATGHKIVRDRSDIAQSNEACFYLNMQVSGRGLYTQFGEEQLLQPASVTLIDSTAALSIEHISGKPYEAISLLIPKSLLEENCEVVEACLNKALNIHTPLGIVLSNHMANVVDNVVNLNEKDVEFLLDGLVDLLSKTCESTLGISENGDVRGRSKTLMEIECYLSANLRDPDLSIEGVSAAFGISTRYIYRLFAESGITFRGWLSEQRLKIAFADLIHPSDKGTSISTIAYRSGFNDLSHFNRAFKRRFQRTPKQVKTGE